MPDWRDEYLANLQKEEQSSPVNKDLVAACSQLADRVAALEAEKAVLLGRQPQSSASPSSDPNPNAASSSSSLPPSSATNTNTAAGSDATAADSGAAQLRLDLAEALRARGQLDARQRAAEADLRRLRTKGGADDKRVRELTAERNALAARLRDRSEELVGKNRLLEDVQDENLTLNIELDARDRELRELRADNKQLVDRWMRRVAQDAEAMNLANASEPDPLMANGRR